MTNLKTTLLLTEFRFDSSKDNDNKSFYQRNERMENSISGHGYTRMLIECLLLILMRVKPPHELLLKVFLDSLCKPKVKI